MLRWRSLQLSLGNAVISRCVLSVQRVGNAHAAAGKNQCCWWATQTGPSSRVRQRILPDSLVSMLQSISGRVVEASSAKESRIGLRLACRSLLLGRWRAGVLRGAGHQHPDTTSPPHSEPIQSAVERPEEGATRTSTCISVMLWRCGDLVARKLSSKHP